MKLHDPSGSQATIEVTPTMQEIKSLVFTKIKEDRERIEQKMQDLKKGERA